MGVEGAEGGSTTLEIEPSCLVLQGGGNGGSKRESPTLKVEPRRSISQVEGADHEIEHLGSISWVVVAVAAKGGPPPSKSS